MNGSVYGMFCRYSSDLCKKTSFRRFGGTTACVKNDILYSFSLKRMSNNTYTVEFGVRPLCGKLLFVEAGDFDVSDFFENGQLNAVSIEEIWPCITTIVLPFFDNCENAGSALRSTICMYHQIEKKRQEYLTLNHISDRAWPIEKRIYYDESVFGFAMKSLDFETMIKSLSIKLSIAESKIDLFSNGYSEYLTEADLDMAESYKNKKEQEEKNYRYLKLLFDKAQNRDVGFFCDEIVKREEESKKRLPKKLWAC